MGLALAIGLVIGIIAILLVFWLVKKVVKALFFTGLILLAAIIILGLFVYSDSIKLKENIATTDSLFLLKDGKIYAGFRAKFGEQYGSEKKAYIIEEDELAKFNQDLENNDLQSIKGDRYKIFFVRENTFDDIEFIQVYDEQITRTFALDLIKSDEAVESVAAAFAQRKGVEKELILQELKRDIRDDNEMRAMLFMRLFATKLENQGPLFIVRELKNKHIAVWPETSVFKAMRFVPLGILDNFIEKLEKGVENGDI